MILRQLLGEVPIMHLTPILQSNLFLVAASFTGLYTHEFRQPSTAFRKSFLKAWQSHDIQTGARPPKGRRSLNVF